LIALSPNTSLIDEEAWVRAKQSLAEQSRRSTMLEVCQRIIQAFEAENGKRMYLSDFETFARESRLEDF